MYKIQYTSHHCLQYTSIKKFIVWLDTIFLVHCLLFLAITYFADVLASARTPFQLQRYPLILMTGFIPSSGQWATSLSTAPTFYPCPSHWVSFEGGGKLVHVRMWGWLIALLFWCSQNLIPATTPLRRETAVPCVKLCALLIFFPWPKCSGVGVIKTPPALTLILPKSIDVKSGRNLVTVRCNKVFFFFWILWFLVLAVLFNFSFVLDSKFVNVTL